jgi:hypothetical protein
MSEFIYIDINGNYIMAAWFDCGLVFVVTIINISISMDCWPSG